VFAVFGENIYSLARGSNPDEHQCTNPRPDRLCLLLAVAQANSCLSINPMLCSFRSHPLDPAAHHFWCCRDRRERDRQGARKRQAGGGG
jgi:hypothetical protein